MSDWTNIVDDLIDHVNLLKELGGRNVELDLAVLSALGSTAAAPLPPGPPAGEAAALSPEERRKALSEIAARADLCEACPLRPTRAKSVPGQGKPDSPDVMFIGETPEEGDDQQGLAFAGAAGAFLTKMIQAMGYTRDDVFVANICKCRPPGNRAPLPEELRTCLPFLREQIRIVRPKVIVLLGPAAITGLLDAQAGASRRLGQWTKYDGIPVMPTFHPSYILRFEAFGDVKGLKAAKTQLWDALKLVLAQLGRAVPGAPAKQ